MKGEKNKQPPLKLIILFVFFWAIAAVLSANSFAALNAALSDQGTGVMNRTTGQLLGSGNLTIEIWDSLTGGNLIYNETFENAIVNGSWNVMAGETTPLPLEFGKKYYRDYRINGEDASFVNGSGSTVGRQFFYSPLGDINTSDIADKAVTSEKLEESINLSNATGYKWDNLGEIPPGFADGIDDTGAGEKWNITTSNYLINQSGILYINETKLNLTIDARNVLGSNITSDEIVNGTIIDADISDDTNLTLGQKITFALGAILDNIVDGWMRITGSLNVTGNVTVQGTSLKVSGTEVCLADGTNCQPSGSGIITYLNFTTNTHDGNITNGSLNGYHAANVICNSSFAGTHLCTEHEIASYIANNDISRLPTLDARVIAGGPKYAPASHPVNDCEGLTTNGVGATDPLGNYWSFNNETGGAGRCANCALSFKLACCK